MKPPANAVRGKHDVGLYSDTDPGDEVAEHFDRGTPVCIRIGYAKKLVEIYSYYVLNTAVSFEYEVPSVADFENRIKTTKEKYP